jgi:N-acetylglucosamine-6-phosphate deacetylase
LQQSDRLASENPARVAGLKTRGRIEAWARADFVVLDSTGKVMKTVIGGRES